MGLLNVHLFIMPSLCQVLCFSLQTRLSLQRLQTLNPNKPYYSSSSGKNRFCLMKRACSNSLINHFKSNVRLLSWWKKDLASLETVITSCHNDYQILHWHIVTTTVNEWSAPINEDLNAPMHARKLLECTINCAGDNIDWWCRNVIDNAEHAKKHLAAVLNTNQVISVFKEELRIPNRVDLMIS